MAPRTCRSASTNLFPFEAPHALSYSTRAFGGTFNFGALTVVDCTADSVHGKQFSSSAAGLISNVESLTMLIGGLSAAPKRRELGFCAYNGATKATMLKT